MSAQPANFTRSASNAAWSFARNVNAILPNGQVAAPVLGAQPASQKLGKNANGSWRP